MSPRHEADVTGKRSHLGDSDPRSIELGDDVVRLTALADRALVGHAPSLAALRQPLPPADVASRARLVSIPLLGDSGGGSYSRGHRTPDEALEGKPSRGAREPTLIDNRAPDAPVSEPHAGGHE